MREGGRRVIGSNLFPIKDKGSEKKVWGIYNLISG